MNRQTFDRIYPKELTPKQNEVLELFLQGETDEDIAYKIDATHRTTTCKHLRNIS
jgi:DNA-binding NarL/FixJ family response regulator